MDMPSSEKDSSFLLLPLEIRAMIYNYLIPNEDDICINFGFSRAVQYPGCVSHTDCYEAASLRKDGDKCHLAVLAVNRGVYAEASAIVYARTYTIMISTHETVSHSCRITIKRPGDWKNILRIFPIHRIKALRLRVLTPPNRTSLSILASHTGFHTWNGIYERLDQVISALHEFASSERRLLKYLIIDVSEPCCLPSTLSRVEPCMSNLGCLFSRLSHHRCGVEDYQINLPLWAKDCADTVRAAKNCGREMASLPDCLSCSNIKVEKASSQEFGKGLVVQVKELVAGDGTGKTRGPTITEWHTQNILL